MVLRFGGIGIPLPLFRASILVGGSAAVRLLCTAVLAHEGDGQAGEPPSSTASIFG